MNCAKIKDQLGAYLDGELKAVMRKQVDEHLPGCFSCREELASERRFNEFAHEVNSLFDEPVPPGFLTRVSRLALAERAPVEGRAAGSSLIWQWLRPFSPPLRAAIVAALLLAGFGGVKSGRIVTDLVADSSSSDQTEAMGVLGMMPAEREMMQLMHGAKISAFDQTPQPSAQKSGEQQ